MFMTTMLHLDINYFASKLVLKSHPPHHPSTLVPLPISHKGNMWKAEIDAGETARNYERARNRLESATDIHPSDKEDIKRFVNHLLADGVGKERLSNTSTTLRSSAGCQRSHSPNMGARA
jgi:hypothetical protein